MANYQIMAMAPPDIREWYFKEVFDHRNMQARNKRLCLQMENEELTTLMKMLEKEKHEMKMESKRPADCTQSDNENEAKEEENKDTD